MKKYLYLLFILCSVTITKAQTTINGLVIDEETDEPLIGATLVEKGTTRGTVTDLDGGFTLLIERIPTTLVINFIGYAPYEYEIKNTEFHTI